MSTQDLGVLGVLGASAQDRVEKARAEIPFAEIVRRAQARGPAKDALKALRDAERPAIVAEFKRRSPSKGAIREDADPAAQARAYTAAGASVLSVLTEPTRFGGSLGDLDVVRASTDLPILEKDFVVDPYQIYEARAHGADLVLLIVKLVGTRLGELLRVARELGMTALTEVHDEQDLALAHASSARLIGVNSRDLRSLAVDLQGALALVPKVRTDAFVLAESGLSGQTDVRRAIRAGADGVLVGEYLMRAGDPGAAVRELRSAGSLFVKICGTQSIADAEAAKRAGADAVGFVFARSPRQVGTDLARAVADSAAGTLERIGVFTTQGTDEILNMARTGALTGVQLHGEAESPERALEIRHAGLDVLAAVVRGSGEGRDGREALRRAGELSRAGILPLLDAKAGDRPDGKGGHLDLDWAREAGRQVRRFVIAGGLTPDTVAQAVRDTDAYGVDVSSGVETVDPDGRRSKDPDRTARFVAVARDAARASRRWRTDAAGVAVSEP